MSRLNLIAAVAALFVLGACATATPYQPASGSERGYSERQIETNRFKVQFAGNSLTDRKTVETYLLYRAAELTQLNGYDHFRVVERDTDAESRIIGNYSPYYNHFRLHYSYFGPHAGYFYRHPHLRRGYVYYDPFWAGPETYREVTRYIASAEILMGKGEKPDDAAFFDAADVIFNLHDDIVRPEA